MVSGYSQSKIVSLIGQPVAETRASYQIDNCLLHPFIILANRSFLLLGKFKKSKSVTMKYLFSRLC